MNILLVEGNQKTRFLIKILQANDHHVMVVGQDYSWCKTLADTFEITAICGDGTKPYILKDAQADKMDTVIALGDEDSANLIVCELAKTQFHVKNVYAVINDPKNADLFKKLGVDKCVSTVQLFAEIIEQESIEDNIKKYLPIENGRVVICEVILDEKSPVLKKKLWEIGFPPQSMISCIIRGDQTIIPQGSTELAAGDKAIVISSSEVVNQVLSILTLKKSKR